MSSILMNTLFYKQWYYKEKFDADHSSKGLKGLNIKRDQYAISEETQLNSAFLNLQELPLSEQ